MKIPRYFWPNLLTAGNLFLGCIGIVYALTVDFIPAVWLMLIAALLDFLDGFVARLIKGQSKLGVQLDSLADMVTFGVLPGVILINLLDISFRIPYIIFAGIPRHYLVFIGFLIVVFSALRLAIFNNSSDEQSDDFIGLPTPANALLVAGFGVIFHYDIFGLRALMVDTYFLYGYLIIGCFLLVSPIRMINLKFKSFEIKTNFLRYLLILISIIWMLWLQLGSLAFIILTYLGLSLINHFIKKQTIKN